MTTATLPGWLPRRSAETAWPWPGSPGQPSGCQPGGGAATPPATATITTDVTFRGLTSGQTASVTVTATATGQVLASATVTPATDGTATRTLTVTGLPATQAVTVLARGGTEQCRSSLGTGSAPPTLSCGQVSH